MGVNACDRAGCQNILCYKLLQTGKHQYYICGECQSELEEEAKHWPKELSKKSFFQRIDDFMASETEGETIEPVRYLDKLLSEGGDKPDD